KEYNPKIRGKGSTVNFRTLHYGYYSNSKELLNKLQQLEELILKEGHRLENIDQLIDLDAGTQSYFDLLNVLNYLSKGISKYSQGIIEGRRMSVSRNLLKD
ncbi:MAG: hypothetical protein ACK5LE_08665, partial [Alphaproteobacteria bacterium]